METITVGQLLDAVHGTLLGGSQDMELTVSGVDTDSRDIHPGSLFIPLVGERFDGHAYITSALEAGAAGCLTALCAYRLPGGQVLHPGGQHRTGPAGPGRLV